MAGAAPAYDLVLKGARVIDGTGNPWFRAEIGVRGDTIVAVGLRLQGSTRRVVNVDGQIVAPGFVDLHTHARRGIFDLPTADNYVRQGVTTVLEGQDGGSPIPLREFLDRISRARVAVNFGMFIGQGSVRREVIGSIDRAATLAELSRMKAMVRQGMSEGAFGLSTGLFYVPGVFTPTEEVVELARVAGEMGGIYISHMRDEAAGVVASVEETIAIGERANLPVQITHHKVIGSGQWGKSEETLRLVAAARERGLDVTMDQYPYTASSTGLEVLLPVWSREGGAEKMRGRLSDPATRVRIQAGVVDNLRNDRGAGDARNVRIAFCGWDPSLAGKTLAEITQSRGREPNLENAAQTAIEIVEKGSTTRAIFHSMSEPDVERILRDPRTMIASDGEVALFGKASPHPRSYGTFARVLGVYVREKKVVSLEEAIRKMTSFPAQRLGLADRGLLRPGMKADLVVFDPERVSDKATYDDPHQYAEGFSLVLVNGVVVFEKDRMTGARPGRVLYGPAHQSQPLRR